MGCLCNQPFYFNVKTLQPDVILLQFALLLLPQQIIDATVLYSGCKEKLQVVNVYAVLRLGKFEYALREYILSRRIILDITIR